MSRLRAGVAWTVTVAAALVIGAVAGRATVHDPGIATVTPHPVLYQVHAGQISSSLRFSATASWPVVSRVDNQSDGVITAVRVTPGQTVAAGDVLFSTNLRPVVAGVGSIPSFRTLSEGVKGADVTELERLLASQGLWDAPPSDDFTSETRLAVEAWQTKLGIQADGKVQPGDVVYLPRLPAKVVLSSEIARGRSVTADAGQVEVLGSSPTFSINLSNEQSNLVPLSGQVTVEAGTHSWVAQITSSTTDAAGNLILRLSGPKGAPVCGSECGSVPAGKTSVFPALVVVVPKQAGPQIPVAAIQTDSSGGSYVVTAHGTHVPVTIRGTANGQAIVSGVSAGSSIQLFGPPSG